MLSPSAATHIVVTHVAEREPVAAAQARELDVRGKRARRRGRRGRATRGAHAGGLRFRRAGAGVSRGERTPTCVRGEGTATRACERALNV